MRINFELGYWFTYWLRLMNWLSLMKLQNFRKSIQNIALITQINKNFYQVNTNCAILSK